tara:strand:+ start:2906 stop:3118 length:213 start_codon:yes stop_codon:yes gene_type:complete
MTNSIGQTTLGLVKGEIAILLDALEGQNIDDMTPWGIEARTKLINRLSRANLRLKEPRNGSYAWPPFIEN